MLHVLILDDDAFFCELLVRSLCGNTALPIDAMAVMTAESAYTAVHQAASPFDVFLIDQRLGPDKDGVEVLRELLRLSPTTDAIVFTGFNDLDNGLRAYSAGAFRYLPKPVSPSDLVYNLQTLHAWRKTRHERDILKVLTDIAEQAQRAQSVAEMGEVIVEGGLRLGFERARLWLLNADGKTLIGSNHRGNQGLDGFVGFSFPSDASPYASQVLASREPMIFHDEVLGESYLNHPFAQHGYQGAKGEWIGLPLWLGERCLGILMLDNFTHPRAISVEQRRELILLGQQVAVALDRVQRAEREAQQQMEREVLAAIGHSVAMRAAIGDLDALLWEVRQQVGKLIDVSSFMVVLRDEQEDWLDFRLDIEDNQRIPRGWLPVNEGFVARLIQLNQSLLLPQGGQNYRAPHGIPIYGKQSRCWLGVPLQVERQTIGAIVVQNFEHENAYTEAHQQLLIKVAERVAGPIQTARLKEEATANASRLEVIQRASAELLKLAEQDEEQLWHTTLTVATAGYGLGFNRGMLFLVERGGMVLQGHMGSGALDSVQAHREWEENARNPQTFDGYLQGLRTEPICRNGIGQVVPGLTVDLTNAPGAFGEVLRQGRRAVISKVEAKLQLPPPFLQIFGETEYALLPIHTGRKPIGLLMVDNKYNGEPIRRTRLDQLDALLAQAALVYDNCQQRKASDKLVEVSREVLEQAPSLPLKETLQKICDSAQVIAGADCVVIYPLLPDCDPHEPYYDVENTAYVGLQHDFPSYNRPTSVGMTMRILQSKGLVLVPDVTKQSWYKKQSEGENLFLIREQIQAFIAVPIRDGTSNASTGLLYLNFRARQRFTEHDVQRAHSFAKLVSAAIRTSLAGQRSRAHARELNILRSVLQTALEPHADVRQHEEILVCKLLEAVRDLLEAPDVRIALLLRTWETPNEYINPREIGLWYKLSDGPLLKSIEHNLYHGMVGEALRTGEDQCADDITQPPWNTLVGKDSFSNGTRSEMDVLIRVEKHHILGLFNVQSPRIGAFAYDHQEILKRLGLSAALALGNLRRQESLSTLQQLVEKVIAATQVEEILSAVLDAARRVAPELAALTTWYKEPISGAIVPGPSFGVFNEHQNDVYSADTDTVLARVMHTRQSVWVHEVQSDDKLNHRLLVNERIKIAAALPLTINSAGTQGETLGALFFYYHWEHEFTYEEQALFPVIAAIAADGIRDVQRQSDLRKQRQRLLVAMDINKAVGTTLDLDGTLRGVLTTLRDHFADRGVQPCVLTYNSTQRALEFPTASLEFYHSDYPVRVHSLDVDAKHNIVCKVARQALETRSVKLENVRNVDADSNYIRAIGSTCSELCLALLSTEKRDLLGVLVLESDKPNAFNHDDEDLIKGVGPSISIAIERAKQSAELNFQTSVAAATAWISEMAHDLNSAVGAIRDHADWLQTKLSGDLLHRALVIDSHAGRLAEITEAPYRQGAFALDDWLQEHLATIITQGRVDSGIEIEFIQGCGKQVLASKDMLERVLRHLIRNALQAMKSQRRGRIVVQTAIKGIFAEVRVANSGPDIPADVRQQIFVKQVIPNENILGKRGRGLLFARWAIKMMGGEIALLSKPGEEVTFGFTLPLVEQNQPEEKS